MALYFYYKCARKTERQDCTYKIAGMQKKTLIGCGARIRYNVYIVYVNNLTFDQATPFSTYNILNHLATDVIIYCYCYEDIQCNSKIKKS